MPLTWLVFQFPNIRVRHLFVIDHLQVTVRQQRTVAHTERSSHYWHVQNKELLRAKPSTQSLHTWISTANWNEMGIGVLPKHLRCLRHGPLTRYVKLRVAHAPGMPGTFSPDAEFKGKRELAIPACITARAWRTCRDACRDCLPAVAGKCSRHSRRMRTRNFTYLARGPCWCNWDGTYSINAELMSASQCHTNGMLVIHPCPYLQHAQDSKPTM